MADLLAKPFGEKPITLQAHTEHVISEAKTVLKARPFWEKKYHQVTGIDLKNQLVRAAKLHDKGKAHEIWQSACRRDREYYEKTGKENGSHLRRCGLRHEFASLWWAKENNIDLTLPEKAAIAAHHRKLSYKHKHRWKNDANGSFVEIWEDFLRYDYNRDESASDFFEQSLLDRFEIAGVRSLLQLADHRASREEAGGKLPPIRNSFDYGFNHPAYRPVQKAALKHANEQELILRAPTGSGKTDAALLWAKYQIENSYADRLVIAMPTRFTSNSLDKDISKDVSSTGLYHSSAWFARYQEEFQTSEQNRDYVWEVYNMARHLLMPASISTIDHLLMALTGTREDHHSIFFNLMNSCVVIDEADFYDEFVQANITKLLEVLRVFDVRVLIMSATVPESAKELYGIEKLVDPYTSSRNKNSLEGKKEAEKKRCNILIRGQAEKTEEMNNLFGPLLLQDNPQAIIYANTVNRALIYYDWFSDKSINPILYHSRFTEIDKKRVEGNLINALGKDTWKVRQAKGVAILTQIGEMSLNISAPVMFSDLCPMDRLAQRAGRLSRFEGMKPGNLHIITPVKNGELYPAPYGDYNREEREWKPGKAFLETQKMLKEGVYTAKNFVDAVNDLYPKNKPFGERSAINKKELHNLISNNWLIVQAAETQEDDFETSEWLSRDIPPQRTVFTLQPPNFDSYQNYRKFELAHGISTPVWQIETGRRMGRVFEVPFYIGDEENSVPCSKYYSPNEGLILNKARSRSTDDQIID